MVCKTKKTFKKKTTKNKSKQTLSPSKTQYNK